MELRPGAWCCRKRRLRRCLLAVGCAIFASACLAPKYSVQSHDGAVTSDADLNTPPPNLRYCSPLPTLPITATPAPDWSCVAPVLAGDRSAQVAILGRFLERSVERIDYCSPALHDCHPIPYEPGALDFTMPSDQVGNGVVHWRRGDAPFSATFWHSLTTRDHLSVGSFWLFSREEAKAYVPGIPLPDGQGVAIIGLNDCSKLNAAGARFAALSVAGQLTGTHFSLSKLTMKPKMTPTDDVGTGGLFALAPGITTFYAYVADGCIVAEASVVVEAERVAYVFLVPNGFK